MQLSAIAYNLKKYLKFTQKRGKSGAASLALIFDLKNTLPVAHEWVLSTMIFRRAILT